MAWKRGLGSCSSRDGVCWVGGLPESRTAADQAGVGGSADRGHWEPANTPWEKTDTVVQVTGKQPDTLYEGLQQALRDTEEGPLAAQGS